MQEININMDCETFYSGVFISILKQDFLCRKLTRNFNNFPMFENRRGLIGSVLPCQTKNQASRPRPDIKTKYENYFFITLILYMSGMSYSLKSTPNDRCLRIFFMAALSVLRVLARNLLRRNRRRNIFVSISDLEFELGPYI